MKRKINDKYATRKLILTIYVMVLLIVTIIYMSDYVTNFLVYHYSQFTYWNNGYGRIEGIQVYLCIPILISIPLTLVLMLVFTLILKVAKWKEDSEISTYRVILTLYPAVFFIVTIVYTISEHVQDFIWYYVEVAEIGAIIYVTNYIYGIIVFFGIIIGIKSIPKQSLKVLVLPILFVLVHIVLAWSYFHEYKFVLEQWGNSAMSILINGIITRIKDIPRTFGIAIIVNTGMCWADKVPCEERKK